MRARFTTLFVAIATLLVPAARADMGPRSDIKPVVRLENLDAYPDYDFYLLYGLGNGNPYASPHVTRVSGNAPTPLEGKGSRLTEVVLAAVPRGQPAPVLKWPFDGDFLPEKQPGEFRSAPLTEVETGEGFVSAYRVVSFTKDGSLQVTPLGSHIQPAAWAVGHIITILVALALTALLVWLGLRLARRWSKAPV